MHTKNIPSTEMEVNNNYDQDNQENYIEMDPKMPLDQPDEEYDYVRMSRPENQENGKLDIEWLQHRIFDWLKKLSVPIQESF